MDEKSGCGDGPPPRKRSRINYIEDLKKIEYERDGQQPNKFPFEQEEDEYFANEARLKGRDQEGDVFAKLLMEGPKKPNTVVGMNNTMKNVGDEEKLPPVCKLCQAEVDYSLLDHAAGHLHHQKHKEMVVEAGGIEEVMVQLSSLDGLKIKDTSTGLTVDEAKDNESDKKVQMHSTEHGAGEDKNTQSSTSVSTTPCELEAEDGSSKTKHLVRYADPPKNLPVTYHAGYEKPIMSIPGKSEAEVEVMKRKFRAKWWEIKLARTKNKLRKKAEKEDRDLAELKWKTEFAKKQAKERTSKITKARKFKQMEEWWKD